MLGVDVFLAAHTKLVEGKRVGLLTNQTGKNSAGDATADLLAKHPKVNLVALFAPEHGIRGTVAAGEHVGDSTDPQTGLPVYSLYGIKGHAPTPEMLKNVDVVVYDIQDVGSRAYTYIWSMAETLSACAKNKKTLIILDRPNPMTAAPVDGPITEDKWKSFLGLYPIPRVYGMTVGELALYFNSEYKLGCAVTVVPMAGYRRDMAWKDTGLTWTASSPNIPTVESAICFAATGTIGTLGNLDIGIGGYYPFQSIGAPWINAEASAKRLNAYGLPGVTFVQAAPYQPKSGPFKGKTIEAVFIRITDPSRFYATTVEVVLLHHLQTTYPKHMAWPAKSFNSFDKAMGTSTVRESLMKGSSLSRLVAAWQPDQVDFMRRRAPFLLYK